jgi:hypothetical protein
MLYYVFFVSIFYNYHLSILLPLKLWITGIVSVSILVDNIMVELFIKITELI